MNRIVRHRKLSDANLQRFEREAELILARTPYKTLAKDAGLTLGSTQQIMAQILREKRQHLVIVRRGTKLLDAEIGDASAMIQTTSGETHVTSSR